jgi:hypothetical protein
LTLLKQLYWIIIIHANNNSGDNACWICLLFRLQWRRKLKYKRRNKTHFYTRNLDDKHKPYFTKRDPFTKTQKNRTHNTERPEKKYIKKARTHFDLYPFIFLFGTFIILILHNKHTCITNTTKSSFSLFHIFFIVKTNVGNLFSVYLLLLLFSFCKDVFILGSTNWVAPSWPLKLLKSP